MTDFKPFPAKTGITLREKYGPCAEITTQEDADRYFALLVEHNMSFGDHTQEEAEAIEHANIGYYSGYYDPVTMNRMLRLFRCSHPVFGDKCPTQMEALQAGIDLGSKRK